MRWPWSKKIHNEWIEGFKAGFRSGFDQAFMISYDQIKKSDQILMDRIRSEVRDEYVRGFESRVGDEVKRRLKNAH